MTAVNLPEKKVYLNSIVSQIQKCCSAFETVCIRSLFWVLVLHLSSTIHTWRLCISLDFPILDFVFLSWVISQFEKFSVKSEFLAFYKTCQNSFQKLSSLSRVRPLSDTFSCQRISKIDLISCCKAIVLTTQSPTRKLKIVKLSWLVFPQWLNQSSLRHLLQLREYHCNFSKLPPAHMETKYAN